MFKNKALHQLHVKVAKMVVTMATVVEKLDKAVVKVARVIVKLAVVVRQIFKKFQHKFSTGPASQKFLVKIVMTPDISKFSENYPEPIPVKI